ncbi:daunorubicin/doxorubicin resistance ATP-binding protein DrrA [bacterium BMS3Abin04]|nr:daunorubicin/doxorubicin resistance ATP-binding protein DrrA [bacterium BMS3Abin04]
MYSIEISNLTKVYNKKKNEVRAINDLTLNISQGIIYGLLGPNGAGKTTLIKILLGIVHPTLGNAKVLGVDINDYSVRRKIGYLPENHKFPQFLTAEGVMKYFAELSGVEITNLDKEIDRLLDLVNMSKWKKTKIKKFSKGMMQRLGLAQALISNPDLIFLDEPTDGVDPIGRKEIRDLLVKLKNDGKTIFLNSHLLSEVELVSDRIAILNKGSLIKEGTVEEITASKQFYIIHLENELPNNIVQNNLKDFTIKKSDNDTNTYECHISDTVELNRLIDILRANNVVIRAVTPQKNTLEDMFISLINKSEQN